MKKNIEEYDIEKLKAIPFWCVTEEEPDGVNLTSTTIDEAVREWKEKVDDDPESYVDPEIWEQNKNNPDARITVTAYRKVEHNVEKWGEEILDDVLTRLEENDMCDYENVYRSSPALIEASEKFAQALKENIDPWYYPAFDVLVYLNKKNDEIYLK